MNKIKIKLLILSIVGFSLIGGVSYAATTVTNESVNTTNVSATTFAAGLTSLHATGITFSDGTTQTTASTADSDWLTNGVNIYNGNAGKVGIGTSVPTSKFSVVGSSTFQLTSLDKFTIDAFTNDTTIPNAGAIDIDVDAADGSSNVAGATLGFNVQTTTPGVSSANIITVNGPSAGLATSNTIIGQSIGIFGQEDDQAGSVLSGLIVDGSDNGGDANVNGITASFTEPGLMGSGDFNGFTSAARKSDGSGNLGGMYISLSNELASTADSVKGINININLGTPTPQSTGLYISSTGSNTLDNGILISGTTTTALDLSDDRLVNAIDIGTNSLVFGGSFNINTSSASASTIELSSSEGGDIWLKTPGIVFGAPGSDTVAAGETIASNSTVVFVDALAAVVLSEATPIANGVSSGQLLILKGTSDVNTITINDNTNVQLGSATRVLGNNDTLTLLWDTTDWLETSYSDN